jgi:hypothetical protein
MTSHAPRQPYRSKPSATFALLLTMLLSSLGATAARSQEFTLTAEQFNSWLTNRNEPPEQINESQLVMLINSVDRTCRLTPEQKQKLELAGHGDVDRFGGELQQLRKKLVGKTFDQNEMGNVYQQISPYRERLQAGLLGEGSLFERVLSRTLNAEQLERYEQEESQRRALRYAAKVRLYVATLEHSIPMTDSQRQFMVNWLLENSHPPRRFGQGDLYYTMYQASKIPIDELEKVFNEAQMKVLKPAMRQGEGYGHYVQQQGMLSDEDLKQDAEKARERARARTVELKKNALERRKAAEKETAAEKEQKP